MPAPEPTPDAAPEDQESPDTGAGPGFPRWMKVAVPVTVAFALAFVWLWNGPGGVHQPPLRAFELVRAPGGEWPALPIDDDGWSFDLSLEVGSTTSQTTVSSSRAASARGGARFAGRSVLVAAASGDSVTAAVTWHVLRALQGDPVLERIACLPAGAAVSGDAIAPDLVLWIENTTPDSAESRARFVARLTDELKRSRTLRTAGKGRGRVEFSLDLEAESEQTFQGIATRSARFTSLTQELARALAGKLLEELAIMRAEYRVLPPLPAEFYPESRPASDLAAELLDVASLDPVASWRGVFLHRESWWRGTVPLPEAEALASLRDGLVSRGFELTVENDEGSLMFARGNETVLAFVESPARRFVGSTVVQRPDVRTPVVLRLRNAAGDDSVHEAIEATLVDDSDLALLAAFRSHWTDAHESRALTVLEERAEHPEHLLMRSSMRRANGNIDGAVADLRGAWLLAQVQVKAGGVVDRIEKAAEKLDRELDVTAPTAAELERFGFVELRSGEPLEREVTIDRPIRAWFDPRSDKEGLALVGVGLHENDDGEFRAAIRTSHGAGSQESSDMGVGGYGTGLISGSNIRCEVLDDPGDGLAKVRIVARR